MEESVLTRFILYPNTESPQLEYRSQKTELGTKLPFDV